MTRVTSPLSERFFSRAFTRTMSPASAPLRSLRDQHRTPLLDEERVCYRVLPPTHQHSRKYQESAPIRGFWQSTLRVYHAAPPVSISARSGL